MILSLLIAFPLLQVAPQDTHAEPIGVPVLSVGDLVLKPYRPQHVNPADLGIVLRGTLGRQFYVRERGGLRAEPVRNTTQVGDLLLLFDEPEYVESMLGLCAEIDAPEAGTKSDMGTLVYRARFLSMDRLERAARSMKRQLDLSYDESGGRLFAAGSEVHRLQLKGILEEIDVPDPRVMMTCYVLRGVLGGETQQSPLLPADLVQDLGKLLPQFSFQPAGFAMLQSSIAPFRKVRIFIRTDLSMDYVLQFEVAAYDAEAGLLTAEGCRLVESDGAELFSADTVLQSGEYTVLGATGPEPILLVIRMEKL